MATVRASEARQSSEAIGVKPGIRRFREPLPKGGSPPNMKRLLLFSSPLGWIALIHADRVLCRLSLGHPGASAAAGALGRNPRTGSHPDAWEQRLIERFRQYAGGCLEQFDDLAVDLDRFTVFSRRVYAACRQIAFGTTVTYGQLAAAAGSPLAGRAVGNCMANNPVPLVIPCHRVVASRGGLGGFSAPGGTSLKRRLLELEGSIQASNSHECPPCRQSGGLCRMPQEPGPRRAHLACERRASPGP